MPSRTVEVILDAGVDLVVTLVALDVQIHLVVERERTVVIVGGGGVIVLAAAFVLSAVIALLPGV